MKLLNAVRLVQTRDSHVSLATERLQPESLGWDIAAFLFRQLPTIELIGATQCLGPAKTWCRRSLCSSALIP